MAANAGYYSVTTLLAAYWEILEYNHVVNINSSVADMISSSTLMSTSHALHKLKAVELVLRFISDDTNVPWS